MSSISRQPIVSVEWLRARLMGEGNLGGSPIAGAHDIVVADCRFDLTDPTAGRRAYDLDHIPGAIYFDLDQDLSGPMTGRGGRHPLPDVNEFCAMLGERGIGDGVTVVCYDDQQGQMAARLWWMLRYVGHDDVVVLDGGYAAWRAAGLPVTTEVPVPTPRQFAPRPQLEMTATMEDVRRVSERGAGIIVDSRAPERYRGDIEPLDPVAGHIPGARNVPWMDNVDASGFFRSREELRLRFHELPQDMDGVIFHCGSGVSACVNLLAMEHAGLGRAKLYVGGWSDWCRVEGNPVAKGDES